MKRTVWGHLFFVIFVLVFSPIVGQALPRSFSYYLKKCEATLRGWRGPAVDLDQLLSRIHDEPVRFSADTVLIYWRNGILFFSPNASIANPHSLRIQEFALPTSDQRLRIQRDLPELWELETAKRVRLVTAEVDDVTVMVLTGMRIDFAAVYENLREPERRASFGDLPATMDPGLSAIETQKMGRNFAIFRGQNMSQSQADFMKMQEALSRGWVFSGIKPTPEMLERRADVFRLVFVLDAKGLPVNLL